jgi:DNA-binding winged helix-turn-helix (wHTH) protein
MRVHFGEFAVDRESQQLWRGDQEVHLVPKAFDLLELLLSERPRAVSKQRIRDRLWPRSFASESTLSSLVVDLRAALEDDARRPRYLRTVHGFGYAFCGATVQAADDAAGPRARQLLLHWGERTIPLSEGENVLGRVAGAVAWIDAPSVSRRHARIVVTGGKATLEDLGSKNGTYLAGAKLLRAAALNDGDEVRLGRVRMTFRVLAGTASTQTDVDP